jgi:hypothetical protein
MNRTLSLRGMLGKNLTFTKVIYSQDFERKAIMRCRTTNEYCQYFFA